MSKRSQDDEITMEFALAAPNSEQQGSRGYDAKTNKSQFSEDSLVH